MISQLDQSSSQWTLDERRWSIQHRGDYFYSSFILYCVKKTQNGKGLAPPQQPPLRPDRKTTNGSQLFQDHDHAARTRLDESGRTPLAVCCIRNCAPSLLGYNARCCPCCHHNAKIRPTHWQRRPFALNRRPRVSVCEATVKAVFTWGRINEPQACGFKGDSTSSNYDGHRLDNFPLSPPTFERHTNPLSTLVPRRILFWIFRIFFFLLFYPQYFVYNLQLVSRISRTVSISSIYDIEFDSK